MKRLPFAQYSHELYLLDTTRMPFATFSARLQRLNTGRQT
jgi:hypothetical protein